MDIFIPSYKRKRISNFFILENEAKEWLKQRKLKDKCKIIKVPYFKLKNKAKEWVKRQEKTNNWEIEKENIDNINKNKTKEFYFVISDDQKKPAFLFGCGFLSIGLIINLLIFNYTTLVLISIFYSLGISIFFHGLLKTENNTEVDFIIPEGENFPNNVFSLTAKLKNSIGIFLLFFILLTLGEFLLLKTRQSNTNQDFQETEKIIDDLTKNIEIELLDGLSFDSEDNTSLDLKLNFKNSNREKEFTVEADKIIQSIINNIKVTPSNGLLFDEENDITLKLKLEFKKFNRDIELSTLEKLSSIFQKKSLTLDDNIIQENNRFNFYTKLKDQKLNVGIINANVLKDGLEKLASYKNDRHLSNEITNKIITECANLSGICNVPDVEKIKVSFGNGIKENEGLVCQKSPIKSGKDISGKENIILSGNANRQNKVVLINKLRPIPPPNPCKNNNNNWIKINKKYNCILFPTANGEIHTKDGLADVFKSYASDSEISYLDLNETETSCVDN